MSAAGCSYFGVRIVRHARRDMADLAARGYTGVLHTVSENDLAYYRGTMAEIFEASHAEGLTRAGEPLGARPDVRRRGGEPLRRVPPRGLPGDGRRPARRRRLPQPAGLSRLLQGVGGRCARDGRRLGLLGRACVGRPGARRRRRRGTLDLPLRRLRRALRRPAADGADAGGTGLPRGVRRRLPARGRRARRRTRRQQHHLPAAGHGGDAGDLRLGLGRVAAGVDDVCDRSVLEALGRAGRPVRQPLRAPAARDLRPPRSRRAAVAAELRAHAATRFRTSSQPSQARARKA